jgi:glycosyltransferase involved in cell wall biosynthesis
MHLFLILGIVFCWVVATVWTQRALSVARNLPRVPNLLESRYDPPRPGVASPGLAQITVIVPARNEGAAIEATLRSLLAQTLPIEILAIDDRSTDRTGGIMDRIAAEELPPGKSLRVIHIDALPRGWLGKPHAMVLAARQATTPWLLFTDGDVLFRADTLERALLFAGNSADHLVLMPTLILKSAGEKMMAAIFQSLTLLAWRPWKIADPRARRESIGMGAFNLVRTGVYRAVGGFEAAPLEVLEDLRLGHAIKGQGYRQQFVLGRELIRLHWAPGAFGMVRNLTKNTFATFRFRVFMLLGAWLGLLLLGFAPFAALAGPWPIRSAGILSLLMIALLYAFASRYYNRIGVGYVLAFPLALTMVLYAMLRSMAVTLLRGGVTWRETFYPLDELRRNAGPLR